MAEKVYRICDYDRRWREPDAVLPRNPADADVIVLAAERWERDAKKAFLALAEVAR